MSFVATDEFWKEDEEGNKAGYYIQSPPNRLKIKQCQSPLRKALSQVNSNITRMTIKEVSSRDIVQSLLVQSSPPKTPFVVTREKFQEFDTPLDKFTARSSNLKVWSSSVLHILHMYNNIAKTLIPNFHVMHSEPSSPRVYRFPEFCNKVFHSCTIVEIFTWFLIL